MACISFPKAIAETGYMEDFYQDSEYQKLLDAITKIAKDLKNEVFGNSIELSDQTWMAKSMLPGFKWIFSFSSIRQRVFNEA